MRSHRRLTQAVTWVSTASPGIPPMASPKVTSPFHLTCVATSLWRGQGSTSWARMRARARRWSRETCIWEKPTRAAIAS